VEFYAHAADPSPETEMGELWIQQHLGFVWTYVRMLGCTADEADDVTQEVFVAALRRRGAIEKPRPFLKATARQMLWARRRKRRRSEPAPVDAADLEAAWKPLNHRDDHPWLDALAACRRELAPRAATAVSLYYGEALSLAALAERLGMKPNGAKTLLQRTRRWLRDCIRSKL